jgi:hypothetical protein
MKKGVGVYTKLFHSIVMSSIWSEDAETCKIWITLLASADRYGCVYGSVVGIAKVSGVSIQKAQEALDKFASPDPNSADLVRAPERQGRRIEVIDGGWRLLNAEHYNAVKRAEERRASHAEASKKYRLKMRDNRVIKRDQPSSAVIESDPLDYTQTYSDQKKTSKEEKSIARSPAKTQDSTPAAPLDIPLELAGLPLYEGDQTLIRRWHKFADAARKAYPGVDFEAEVRKAHAWEVANPTRSKKDRTKFLNNWMSRAQDGGRGASQQPTARPFMPAIRPHVKPIHPEQEA